MSHMDRFSKSLPIPGLEYAFSKSGLNTFQFNFLSQERSIYSISVLLRVFNYSFSLMGGY